MPVKNCILDNSEIIKEAWSRADLNVKLLFRRVGKKLKLASTMLWPALLSNLTVSGLVRDSLSVRSRRK